MVEGYFDCIIPPLRPIFCRPRSPSSNTIEEVGEEEIAESRGIVHVKIFLLSPIRVKRYIR